MISTKCLDGFDDIDAAKAHSIMEFLRNSVIGIIKPFGLEITTRMLEATKRETSGRLRREYFNTIGKKEVLVELRHSQGSA